MPSPRKRCRNVEPQWAFHAGIIQVRGMVRPIVGIILCPDEPHDRHASVAVGKLNLHRGSDRVALPFGEVLVDWRLGLGPFITERTAGAESHPL